MSRISLMAAAMATAQRNTVMTTVTFLGANRPKLANRTVSQRTTAARNGRGTESIFIWDIRDRVSLTVTVSSSACALSQC